MSDRIIRAVSNNYQVKVIAASTTELVKNAIHLHDIDTVSGMAFGQLLTAGSLMSRLMKGKEDLLTLTIKGDSYIQGMTVTADSQARIKGFVDVNQNISVEELPSFMDVIGEGTLSVIKDLRLKEPYNSHILLSSGKTLAEELTKYYANSEQTPTSVGINVFVGKDGTIISAIGYILQLLPFADEALDKLDQNIKNLVLKESDTPEDVISKLLVDFGYTILERSEPEYFCDCSKEKTKRALVSIGRDELMKLSEENETIEIKCDFCNKKYYFSKEDLRVILMEGGE